MDEEKYVLVERTVTVRQMVKVSAYEPATVEGAREYELGLSQEEQLQAVVESIQFLDGNKVQFSVKVFEADPRFVQQFNSGS